MLYWEKRILKKKIEGDKSTPKGTFELIKLYYRADRVKKTCNFT